MKYVKTVLFHLTDFGVPDISLGVHLCMKGRIDFHVFTFMLSIGKVPIYEDKNGKKIAVSNSWHTDKSKPVRAGIP